MQDFPFLLLCSLFCFILTTAKVHGRKMVMSTAFFLLPLPILQRSGLQGNEETTITSVLEFLLPV